MNEAECILWLEELTELPGSQIRPTLKPASERHIIARMLNNLKAHFGGRDQWQAALQVQQRLTLLNPGSYREKRDLAILSLKAGRPGEAMTLLDDCVAVCAPEDRPILQQYLSEAKRELPKYN